MYFTIMNLKRVEADDQYYYVTNYFKTYRYLKTDVEKISSSDYGIWIWNTLHMKQATKFGRNIRFIGNPAVYKK
ncbi:MAG: hypothetical protein IPP37_04190 [Saprospiraceae bacterium]|nr:hypothetical protein [Saprospiraceae bacterium]